MMNIKHIVSTFAVDGFTSINVSGDSVFLVFRNYFWEENKCVYLLHDNTFIAFPHSCSL